MVFFVEKILPFATSRSPKASSLESIQELRGSPGTPQFNRWLSFDLAEEMEAGCAHEVTPDSVIFPAQKAEPARRLLMAYSQKQEEYTLISEESEPLLVARSSSSHSSFELYVPTDGKISESQRPMFLLNLSRSVWTLTSQRCDYCACRYSFPAGALLDPSPLARVRHFKNAGALADQGSEVDISTPKPDCNTPCWHTSGFDQFHLKSAESLKGQTYATETFELRMAGDYGEGE